jgi:sulfite exporter TauE/SafE
VSVRFVGDLVFTFALLVVIVAGLSHTLDWPYGARLIPIAIGVPAALLCVALLAVGLWKLSRGTIGEESVRMMDIKRDEGIPADVFATRATTMFVWVLGFAAAIWLFGFLPVVPLYIFLYLVVQAGERWWSAALYGAGMFAFMAGLFHFVLHVAWMRGQFNEPQRLILSLLNQLY